MIWDRDLRAHIFEIPGLLPTAEVGRIIKAIKRCGGHFTNRTHLKPEIARRNVSLPIADPLKGRTARLESIGDIEGRLPAGFVEKTKDSFFQECLQKLSGDLEVVFSVPLIHKPTKLALEGNLVFRLGHALLGLVDCNCRHWLKEQLEDEANWLRVLIALGNLPIAVKKTQAGYEVCHAEGGAVETFTLYVGHKLPTRIWCNLPGASFPEVLSRFRQFLAHPDFQRKPGKYRCSHDFAFEQLAGGPQKNPKGLLAQFNRLRFPGRTAELTYFWHLDNYEDYEEMVAMSALAGEDAAQSLVDFEFGRGKKCQLDAVGDKKGRFKLLFSFDEAEHAADLAPLLKIKLKPYD